jgi:hypothetical protein
VLGAGLARRHQDDEPGDTRRTRKNTGAHALTETVPLQTCEILDSFGDDADDFGPAKIRTSLMPVLSNLEDA